MSVNDYCCEAWAHFITRMGGESFKIGRGEISGYICGSHCAITFDDGWDTYPTLLFNYCPFCGALDCKPDK